MSGKDPNPMLDSGFVIGISEFGDISNHQRGVRWFIEKVLFLTSLLIRAFHGKAPPASPLEKNHRSGIVTVETK
jgi:hypothetical protein